MGDTYLRRSKIDGTRRAAATEADAPVRIMMRSIQLFVTGALALGLLAGSPRQLDARSCVVGLSNDGHFELSRAVFLGQVVEQRVVPHGQDGNVVETTFSVDTQWKGERTSRATVRTCGGAGAVCSDHYTFELGQWYVVFAWGHPLRASSCSLTSTREAGASVLAWLRDRPLR